MGSMNAGNVLDNLQRQVDELEALQTMFPDVQVLEMSALEQQIYATAKLIVDGVEADLAQNALSATIRIPDVHMNGSPVKLRFVLGASYPDSPARLTVECDGPRSDHDALMAVLQQCQEQCEGSEVLLLAVDALKDAVAQLQQAVNATAGASADAPRSAASAQPSARACAVVWFHHIKSLEKRKFIVSRARDLGIRGYSKPGFPGIIVAEGPEEQLDDYISSIRALRWQAMQVRAKEQMPAAVQASASSGGISCFSQPFAELEESGMSDLSQHCSAAGVEHLFLAALKISK